MSLTSSSTYAAVTAQYEDNCDYDLDNSAAKCRLFIQACRFLLRRQAQRVKGGSSEVENDLAIIQAELKKAEAWLSVNDSTAVTTSGDSHRYLDFSEMRD